jgi:hypothetical protein
MPRSALPTALAVCTLCSAHAALAAVPPLFGDWNVVMPEGWRETPRGQGDDPCEHVPPVLYDDPVVYCPVNQTGGSHGGPTYEPGSWMAWFATCYAGRQDEAGAPIGILIRNRNCPFPFATGGLPTNPDALEHALDALPKLDYVILDLETWPGVSPAMVQLNVVEVVRLVRGHPNPRIADAFIGNYADTPNRFDEAMVVPGLRDRTRSRTSDGVEWDRHALYHAAFDLAMPSAYPAEAYSRHSDAHAQHGNATPNDRAAIFWAPLERVSAAARELPPGHRLMPWITNYLASSGNSAHEHAPPPPLGDLIALAQHTRLRGAMSFMLWTPNDGATAHPTVDYPLFRDTALAAWASLDPYFATGAPVEFLNLETDKASGVQWSGARVRNQVLMLVSNLLEADAVRVPLPMIGALPARTVPIAPGSHRVLSYPCDPAVRDFSRDGTVNDEDFNAYVFSFMSGIADAPNTVGGGGGDWRDIDANGAVDHADLILVTEAYWDGRFARFADERRQSDDGDSDPMIQD